MAKSKKSKPAGKPNEGLTGSMGLSADDDVIDTAFQENARPIRPESEGGAPSFEPHEDRQPLAGGGSKRGEDLELAEEDDDFEDGRSSAGITSRASEDQWARGDVGSRAVEDRSGVLSVEAADDVDVAEAARGVEPEPPEDIEGEAPAPDRRRLGRSRGTTRRAAGGRRGGGKRKGSRRRAPASKTF